jgi:hypothetical protein
MSDAHVAETPERRSKVAPFLYAVALRPDHGVVKSRLTSFILEIWVGAYIKEPLGALEVIAPGGMHERRHSVAIRGIDLLRAKA